MNGFEETEFGSRKIVGAAPKAAGDEGGGRRRKGREGSGKAGKAGKARKARKARKAKNQGKNGAKAKAARRTADRKPVVHEQGSGVLVPLDQWTRVLNQLGNIHEAGQQIADARERAAKAETETAFLRERLKEMRAEIEVLKRTDAGGC